MAAKLAAAGAPEEHIAPLRDARARGRIRHPARASPPRSPTARSSPANSSTSPGRRLRAIWTPGHTPGHVCLHLEEEHPARLPGNGRLFSGDHLLPGITPHIGLYEDPDDATVTDPLGDYLDSLERVGRLGPAEVLPAHQHAFTDAAVPRTGVARRTTRSGSPACAPSSPNRSPPGSSPSAWSGTGPGTQIPYGSRNIAVSEAEAHLRRLVKLGRAEAVTGSDPVTYVAV